MIHFEVIFINYINNFQESPKKSQENLFHSIACLGKKEKNLPSN